MIYNIEELRRAYQQGKKEKFLFFWGHQPAKDGSISETCFSQWWKCYFQVKEIEYCCAEQYMMAEKARMFRDAQMLALIMKATEPKAMKAYGRAVKNFTKEKWEKNCYEIVKQGNLAKFSQNKHLWKFMKTTQNRILVEASPRDAIWGIGIGKTNPDIENPMKWKGKNLLGFALTEVRDILLEKESKEAETK